MDRKVYKVIFYINAVIVAFFAMFSSDLYSAIISKTALNNELARPVVLMLAILFILLSEFTIKWLVTKSKFIRHRFIRGREFIEGYWFDVVIVPSTKVIRECGIIEIIYENDEYVVSGTLFDTRAKRVGSFNSRLSKFDGKKIEFAYLRTVEHDILEEELGYSTYNFTRSKPYPIDFNGSFYDPGLEEKVRVRGDRISNKKTIKRLQTHSKNDEQDVAYKHLSQFALDHSDYTFAHNKK